MTMPSSYDRWKLHNGEERKSRHAETFECEHCSTEHDDEEAAVVCCMEECDGCHETKKDVCQRDPKSSLVFCDECEAVNVEEAAAEPTYYAVRRGFLYELRQTCFRDRFIRLSIEHPHDVCALARSAEELKDMYERYLSGGVDWSLVEGK